MRFVLIALAVLAASPALAQTLGAGIPMNQETPKSEAEIERQKATEDAYKKTLKSIPNAKPVDPWGNLRSDDKPKAQAKTTKKTGTAAN